MGGRVGGWEGRSKHGVCDPEWPSARGHVGQRESVQLGRCARVSVCVCVLVCGVCALWLAGQDPEHRVCRGGSTGVRGCVLLRCM